MHGALGLLALANGQIGVTVKPIHPLVIHTWKLWSQQVVDPTIAKAATLMCDLHNAAAQSLRLSTGFRLMTITVPA
jgi:hypothetical protein